MKEVIGDYLTLSRSRHFMQAALVPTLLCGGYMAFVTVIPFLYRDQVGMSLMEFSFHQAAIITSFSVVSFYANRISGYFGERRAALQGLWITSGSTAVLLALTWVTPVPSPYLVTPLMCVFAASCSIGFAVVFSASLGIFPEKNGPASSMIMGMRTLYCATAVQGAAMLYNGTLLPAAVVVAACCSASLALALRFYGAETTSTSAGAITS